MDLDDVMDDGYDEEDYVEEPAMTAEEQAQMAEATEDVLEMLGHSKVSIKEIQDALWYYYFDVDQAVSYLQKKQKPASTKKSTPSAPSTPAIKQTTTVTSSTPSAKSSTPSTASTASKGTVIHDSLRSFLSSPRKQILSKRHVQDWIWRDMSWSGACSRRMIDMELVVNCDQSACDGYRQYQRRRPGRPIGFPVTGLLGGSDPAQKTPSLRSLAGQATAGANRPRPSLAGLAGVNKTGANHPAPNGTGGSPSLADLSKGGGLTAGASSRLGQFSRLAPSSSSSPLSSSSKSLPPSSSPLPSTSSPNPPGSVARPSLASLAKPSALSGSATIAADEDANLPSSTTSPTLAQLASQTAAPARRSLARLAPSSPSVSPLQQPSSKPLAPSSATNTPLSSLASLRNTLPSASPLSSSSTASLSVPPRRSLASLAKPAVAPPNPKPALPAAPLATEQSVDISPSMAIASSTAMDMMMGVEEPSFTLIAPPSHFAVSIFEPLQPISKYMLSNALEAVAQAGRVFDQPNFQLGERPPFQFDQPSPDDIVTKAQSRRPTKSPAKTKVEDDDDIIEIMDDEDDKDTQLTFDMSAMNFGTPSKATTKAAAGDRTPASSAATPSGSGTATPVESAAATPTQKSTPKFSKKIDVMSEYQKRVAEKESLNLVVIGHVDAGKSTLMGHLLYLQGEVNEKTIRKHEREAQKIGKSSFAFAWVLDETGEERARGITMDVGVTKFETAHRRFTLLDAPGHRDFIPNMISGTAQADVAILVIDSTTGEFEAGFEANGQTKEHALLARSLGVQQLVIAINKLDVVQWSEARFLEIKDKLETFLTKEASFRKQNLTFIPCSGFTGENLVQRSTEGDIVHQFAWYTGPTLVETIDRLEAPARAVEKPFRMSATDVFKGTGGVCVAGRLEAGHIQVGEPIMVMPGSEVAVVKAMEVADQPAKWAAAGDQVLLTLSNIDILQVSTQSVLCARDHPIPITSQFAAQIVVFDVKVPITVGFPVIVHHGSHHEPGTVSKLVATIDKVTGEVVKKSPRHLAKNTTATVEIKLTGRPIPLEAFKDNKELGRVMLRKGGDTVAAGIVTKILSFGS
ncbi:hypothetical protein DFQ27_002625 [Actinomortierella ambigua]|uniref:Elongation factor 1 alpha-like protein n=1 Tax=Actinomortierella ambigua TaxID=1343610 RepID=A0A9P6QMS6_9FUNG|nr:hypothetical protein DFQ27_002625 [Actinomortierella ambigua]